jgi:hypothetical protein
MSLPCNYNLLNIVLDVRRGLWDVTPCGDMDVLKVKLSLFLSKHHAMDAYWGVEV